MRRSAAPSACFMRRRARRPSRRSRRSERRERMSVSATTGRILLDVAVILLAFALGLALAAHLHPGHDMVAGAAVPFWPFALFIGASLSLTAFPVLARILQENGLATTPVGTLVITAAAVDDVIGWSVLAI